MARVVLPDDYLRPIWRCYMNGTGVASIALDPRELDYLMSNGAQAFVEGRPYLISLKGMTGEVDTDGRIAVRLEAL